MDDEDIPLVCVPVRGPGSRPPPPAILASRANTVTPDADDDVALICVPKKVGKKKRSKPAAAPPPAAPAPEATKPLPAPAAPAVAKPVVQALVADDDLVRDAGAARKGATFVERVLGAVAANKPRGGKPTPDYVAYVKGYLRSGGGAAPKPKPAKKKEPRADEDGCTCTYRSW